MANAQTWTVFTAGEQVKKMVGTGLYLYPILHRYYRSLLYLFIDYNNNKNRSLKQKLLPIEGTITEDGKSLQWFDYSMFDVEHTFTAGQINNDTLDLSALVDVAATTAGFAEDDWIMIVRKEGSALPNTREQVDSLTATNVVLKNNVTVEVGDRIIRLYYVQPQEVEIERGQSTFNYKEFRSYFQNFARVVSFTKTELNKNYLLESDAKQYVTSIVGLNMSILLQEFNKAVWFGQNTAVGATVAGSVPEMLGIDTAIEEMAVSDASLVIDFSSLGLATDDEKVEAFMDVIEASSASGAIQPWETLSVACNRKFLSKLGRLKQDDVVYNEKITEIDFEIFKFKNMFGQVEFFHEPMLDRVHQWTLAYILPRSLMSMRFRQHQNLNDVNGGMIAAKSEITVIQKINNIHDKAQFDMFFEAATVLGGLSSGAYRKIINL